MTEVLTPPRIVVQALAPAWQAFAEQWAQRLGLPMGEGDADFALQLGDDGLQLLQLGPDSPARCGWTSSKAPRLTAASSAAAPGR